MDGFPVSVTEVLCLGASVTLSSICYYMYKKSRTKVDRLEDAPHFSINGKLQSILNISAENCLRYAVIEGTVQPVGETLKSQFQKETVGVLQKYMLREHRLVWNGLSHTCCWCVKGALYGIKPSFHCAWDNRLNVESMTTDHWAGEGFYLRKLVDSERVLHYRANAVPFVLVGADDTVVKILDPLQAGGVHTETTYEKFHQANYGLGDILGQYLSGEKLKGQLETEEMLRVGSTLTGIGELGLSPDGVLTLQPPSDGCQYFLSVADFDTLKGEQESTSARWKTLAGVFAVVGAAVLLWLGRRCYLQLKLRWERERARRDFEKRRTGEFAAPQGGEEAEEDIENACLICFSRPRDCILLDCGHVCFCHHCHQALPDGLCPLCRQTISRVLPLYYA